MIMTTYPRRSLLDERGEPIYLPGIPGVVKHRRAYLRDLIGPRDAR